MGDSRAKARGSKSASKAFTDTQRALRLERRENVAVLEARLLSAISPAPFRVPRPAVAAAVDSSMRPDPLPAVVAAVEASSASHGLQPVAAGMVSSDGVRRYVRTVHQVPHSSPPHIRRPVQAEVGGSSVTLASVMAMLQQQQALMQAQSEELALLKALHARPAPSIPVASPVVMEPPAFIGPVRLVSSPLDEVPDPKHSDANLLAAIANLRAQNQQHRKRGPGDSELRIEDRLLLQRVSK